MTETMFCYQCQETSKNTGCIIKGVCGKDSITSNYQDILIYKLKNLSDITKQCKSHKMDVNIPAIGRYIIDNLFSTITNANFDPQDIERRIGVTDKRILAMIKDAKENGIKLTIPTVSEPIKPILSEEYNVMGIGIMSESDEDKRSLKELTTYGLKGLAAYAEHAAHLGYEDEDIYSFVIDTLAVLKSEDRSVEELVSLVLKTGEYGVKTMALLDKAHNETYGSPEATVVNIGVRNNPGILISGHDLKDMETLLEQTKGTGVDVYTHSEMLPANYYPKFKKYDHFVGNYGNSWWKQKVEFETFNGPILFTTNCIVPPTKRATYADKVYTTNATGYPGFKHIPFDEKGEKDFSEIIELAKTCQPPTEIESGTIVGGFAHQQVFALADKIVENMKNGSLRKFVVMGGCDGRFSSRDYYKDFAQGLPQDTVILTAGCAKYRYNKLGLGEINGIPRVLDAGQCNDSYSLAMIALKLKEILGAEDINDLPIVYNIAWYEQKAVIVFLALLSLGVKNIHLGPTLPAFLSPNVAKVIVDNFGVAPIGEVETDLEVLVG